jgi:hypothetical protein
MIFDTHLPTLPSMDDLSYDTLVLAYFAEERPLSGVTGLVDWRLNGSLSSLVMAGQLTGEWGEQMLYPQQGRLPFKKIVMFGLGDRAKFGSTRFKEITNRILRTLLRLDCWSFATILPGRSTLKLGPRQLIDLWLGEFQKVYISQRFHNMKYEIGFVEPTEVTLEIDDHLSLFARQHVRRT